MFSIFLKISFYYPSLCRPSVITEMAGTAAHTREAAALKGWLESLLQTVKRRSLTSTGFGQGRRKGAALRRTLLRAPAGRAGLRLPGLTGHGETPVGTMLSLTGEKTVRLSPTSATHLAASPGLPAEGAWGAVGGRLPYPVP